MNKKEKKFDLDYITMLENNTVNQNTKSPEKKNPFSTDEDTINRLKVYMKLVAEKRMEDQKED